MRITCDHCQLMRIQGLICHETGCPNMGAQLIDGEWVRMVRCWMCGEDVPRGETCTCTEEVSCDV